MKFNFYFFLNEYSYKIYLIDNNYINYIIFYKLFFQLILLNRIKEF